MQIESICTKLQGSIVFRLIRRSRTNTPPNTDIYPSKHSNPYYLRTSRGFKMKVKWILIAWFMFSIVIVDIRKVTGQLFTSLTINLMKATINLGIEC